MVSRITSFADLRASADTILTQLLSAEWSGDSLQRLARDIAVQLGHPSDEEFFSIYSLVANHPRILEPSPQRSLDAQLGALLVLGPITHASLWLRALGRQVTCAPSLVSGTATRRIRQAAFDLLSGRPASANGARMLVHAAPVLAFGHDCAALIVRSRPGHQRRTVAYAEEGARALSPILERQILLEHLESQMRVLDAAERRTTRISHDLHDGALQRLSLLIAGLAELRQQLGSFGHRLDECQAMARTAEEELRELVLSLPPTSARLSLETAIRREIGLLRRCSKIPVALSVEGDPERTTPTERIAVVRVVQEALANVSKHARATKVKVSLSCTDSTVALSIVDNGRGFDEATARDAADAGRLGLVGMAERIRLLGGEFQVESRGGGPTAISAILPRGSCSIAAPLGGIGASSHFSGQTVPVSRQPLKSGLRIVGSGRADEPEQTRCDLGATVPADEHCA